MTSTRATHAVGTSPIKLAFTVTETGRDAATGDYFTVLELGSARAARYGWQVSLAT